MMIVLSFLVALQAIGLAFVLARLHTIERRPILSVAIADRLGERLERVEDLVGYDSPFAMKRRKNKAIGGRAQGET